MVTQPIRMEIPWSWFIWVITNHLLTVRCSISSTYLRVCPYGVDKTYSVSIEVEHLLLMNVIFLMNDVFSYIIHLMDSPIWDGDRVTSYESLVYSLGLSWISRQSIWPIGANSLCMTCSWETNVDNQFLELQKETGL